MGIWDAISDIFNRHQDRKAATKAAREANFMTIQSEHNFRQEDRAWFRNDRNNQRDWDQRLTRSDRAYAEGLLDQDREYARKVLLDERVYDEKTTRSDRAYDARITAKDRQYLDKRLNQQRAYDDQMYKRDVHKYNDDRNLMQARSDKYAKATAASRGINFVKLRDDAIKAGYNPMTALSMAHAYSTQVDYATQGGVYSPGASYTTSNQGYSPQSSTGSASGGGSSGGGGGPAATVIPSQAPAAGNFQASGSGFQAQMAPSLSSGGFLQAAIEGAVDLWSNRPVKEDKLAAALRNAFDQDQATQEVRDAQVPQNFGYDLTEERPFRPALTVGVPSLSAAKVAPGPARMPSGIIQKGGRSFIPVTLPDRSQSTLELSVARRYDIKPFDTLSAGDWEEIRGGVVGEAENTINADKNYEAMTGESFWPVPPSASDYLKSGRTGSQMFNSWPSN